MQDANFFSSSPPLFLSAANCGGGGKKRKTIRKCTDGENFSLASLESEIPFPRRFFRWKCDSLKAKDRKIICIFSRAASILKHIQQATNSYVPIRCCNIKCKSKSSFCRIFWGGLGGKRGLFVVTGPLLFFFFCAKSTIFFLLYRGKVHLFSTDRPGANHCRKGRRVFLHLHFYRRLRGKVKAETAFKGGYLCTAT